MERTRITKDTPLEAVEALIAGMEDELIAKGAFAREEGTDARLDRLIGRMPFGCPRCGAPKERVRHNGKAKRGSSRCYCAGCGARFQSNHGSATFRVRKRRELYRCMLLTLCADFSLSQLQRIFGVARKTALDFRHRVCSALGSNAPDAQEGLVEQGTVLVPFRQKGGSNRGSAHRGGGTKAGLSRSGDGRVAFSLGGPDPCNCLDPERRRNVPLAGQDAASLLKGLESYLRRLYRGVSTRYLPSYLVLYGLSLRGYCFGGDACQALGRNNARQGFAQASRLPIAELAWAT